MKTEHDEIERGKNVHTCCLLGVYILREQKILWESSPAFWLYRSSSAAWGIDVQSNLQSNTEIKMTKDRIPTYLTSTQGKTGCICGIV